MIRKNESDIGNEVITEEERNELKSICGESPSGLILLAAIKVGPNKKRVSKITRIPVPNLEPFWTNFKNNGVFSQKNVYLDLGEDKSPESYHLAFALASAVGDGFLEWKE